MRTPITENEFAICGATEFGFEKTWRPSRRWNLGLGLNGVANQIQQVKTATLVTPASRRNLALGQPQQGQAQPVKNLRITRRSINSTQYQVSVSFRANANDRYFQGVSISLQQGDGTLLQVASGKTSPLTFVTAKTAAASVVMVQSMGSFSDTPLDSSPSRSLSLQS